MAAELPEAKYFPPTGGPLTMRPGLFRLGTDFGNGQADQSIFQRDRNTACVLHAKARVLEAHPERHRWVNEAALLPVLRAVLEWMLQRARLDVGKLEVASRADTILGFDVLTRQLAEDFVISHRDRNGDERAVLVHVCFPSGWRPERILGRSFRAIHEPIPEFEAIQRSEKQLIRAMFERGPYVRFVFTVTPDAELDHHPKSERPRFRDARSGYLRVERQVTVPFPEQDASLFVIRTYVYPFDELSNEQRATLSTSLEATSESVLEYKGLRDDLAGILRLLRARP